MLPLADTHVHLLAGLDDGPRTSDEARAMARMLVAEGCRFATALAHQNPGFPDNTAAHLTVAAADLARELHAAGVPLSVFPTGEVMLSFDTLAELDSGKLLTVGGHGKHLLIEMPHGLFLDIRSLIHDLKTRSIRPILAHAERYPELLHDPGLTAAFIAAGCLIQVTANELAEPSSGADERALKNWAKRGVIHVLGSDGHQIGGREPRLRAGYNRLASWAGTAAADRIGSIWGAAVLQGMNIDPPLPLAQPRRWFGPFFGGG